MSSMKSAVNNLKSLSASSPSVFGSWEVMDSAVQRKAPEIMTPLMPGRGERFTAVKHSSAEQKDYLGGEDPAWD